MGACRAARRVCHCVLSPAQVNFVMVLKCSMPKAECFVSRQQWCESFDVTAVPEAAKQLGRNKSCIEVPWLILMIYFEQLWAYGSNQTVKFCTLSTRMP